MKLKAKSKECQLIVKVKTTPKEKLDEKELDRFARLFLRGFLKPKLIKNNAVDYVGPIGIPLYERFKKPISKRDFLFILEQVVVAVQKLRANNLGVNNLVMDLQYVFVNEVTKEVQFIFVPTTTGFQNSNLIEFIETITYSVKPIDEKDGDLISKFVYYFRSMKPFDINKIEAFIEKEDRSIVNTIKKQNAGQSGFMTNKPQHYYDHYDSKNESKDDEDPTELLQERSDDNPTGLLDVYEVNEPTILDAQEDNAIGSYAEDVNDATGLLWDDDNTRSTIAPDYQSGPTGCLLDEDEEATGLLIEDDVVINRFPTLFRVLTEETISVNKPVFRLGKEKSYVDYFVTNNIAVSRSHADIITRGNRYFVRDLNSKNRTFINNVEIPVQTEVEINDGDSLKLANEKFIFRI